MKGRCKTVKMLLQRPFFLLVVACLARPLLDEVVGQNTYFLHFTFHHIPRGQV